MPKTTSKKTTVKRTPRMAEVKPEVHECMCGGGCKCGCACGKFKKFIVLLIVFALGFAVAKFVPCHRGKHFMHPMPEFHPEFVGGCLDIESIKCPKMQEFVAHADADMDGCITEEEFKASKPQMHHRMPKHPAPVEGTEPEVLPEIEPTEM